MQTPIDPGTDEALKKMENICSDRFTNYLIVVMDGDKVYSTYSSGVMAVGAAQYVIDNMRQDWTDCDCGCDCGDGDE